MFKLVIQDDEGKTTVVPLIRDEITIGRKEGNTIRLTERNVSRRHARILRNNGEVQIEDLGSYNGIRVNNARIAERVALRVSDQVQIGDYKLYLKAEGVEQVDDARTMPIERIEGGNGTPTEAMPAVSANPTQPVPIAPTPAMPIAATPPPGTAPQIQVSGNPNRTLVAISDRPLATPELIAAAIPQTTGYGKLVVLSSNFAGKEFELSRPQMIVGRTDENDLVINHRSISRNHAKVVREPDTQRYTISDLQSSNGVRVNGQDYGKVELRRGDVIDLGHVRLRFVEPGEDFVFARDAVITDVPEAGGKKGLLVAIVLGLLVLGGVVVFFMMRGGKEDDNKGTAPKDASGTMTVIDASEQVAQIDAAETAPPDVAVNVTGDRKQIETRCQEAVVKHDWVAVGDCGRELTAAGGDGVQFTRKSKDEGEAEANARAITRALAEKPVPNIKDAQAAFDKIPSTSVYYGPSKDEFNKKYNEAVAAGKNTLNSLARANKCDNWNLEAKRLETLHGKPFADDVRRESTKCVDKAITPPPKPCDSCPTDYECKNDKCVKKPVTVVQPKSICDDAAKVAEITKLGEDALQAGSFGQALGQFDKVLKCNSGLRSKMYLAACRSKQFAIAKAHFDALGKPVSLAQICMKEGYDPRNPPP